jgi:hypothetical protein
VIAVKLERPEHEEVEVFTVFGVPMLPPFTG